MYLSGHFYMDNSDRLEDISAVVIGHQVAVEAAQTRSSCPRVFCLRAKLIKLLPSTQLKHKREQTLER